MLIVLSKQGMFCLLYQFQSDCIFFNYYKNASFGFIYWGFLISAVSFLLYHIVKRTEVHKLQEQRLSIARNLHDDIGGTLYALQKNIENYKSKCDLEDIVQLEYIQKLSNNATIALYDFLWMIDGRSNEVYDLVDKIIEASNILLKPINILPNFKVDIKKNEMRLSPLVRQQLFYIFKEAVNNIVKHSCATNVEIVIREAVGSAVEIWIRNDGINLEKCNKGSGMGIKNMKERALSIDYAVDIHNTVDFFSIHVWPSHSHKHYTN